VIDDADPFPALDQAGQARLVQRESPSGLRWLGDADPPAGQDLFADQADRITSRASLRRSIRRSIRLSSSESGRGGKTKPRIIRNLTPEAIASGGSLAVFQAFQSASSSRRPKRLR